MIMTTDFISEKKEKSSGLRLFIKITLIGLITLVLLIPQFLITNIIEERNYTRIDAQEELSKSWGNKQHIAGPAIIIPDHKNEQPIYLFPNDLKIDGDVKVQNLKRGIFDFNVFNAPLTLTGTFNYPKEMLAHDLSSYNFSEAILFIELGDLRGLNDNVFVNWNGQKIAMESASAYGVAPEKGLCCRINLQELREGKPGVFSIQLSVKGSEELYCCPLGNTTTMTLSSDWSSPCFTGNYLPIARNVSDSGFNANWKILAINREFGQVCINKNSSTNWHNMMKGSEFGVSLCTPADQYQQTTRTVKYALLIILLTFGVILYVDIRKNVEINPVQYLLIGAALLLFYTLLLSFSEHLSFLISYSIATVMTVALITAFLTTVLKSFKIGGSTGALLLALYIFIYVLLQLEVYALLVGSIGLFVILGFAMFATIKLRHEK